MDFIPRGLQRPLNENPSRIPRPLATGSFIAGTNPISYLHIKFSPN